MAVAVCEEKTFWTVQVFVFQNQLIDNHGFDGSQVEIYKAEKDELSALSRLLSLQPVPLDQLVLPLPERIIFLDAVKLQGAAGKPKKRRNPFSRLDYSISSTDSTSAFRLFRLKGKLGKLKFERTVELELAMVHLVQVSRDLYFVLAPYGAPRTSIQTTQEGVEFPRLIKKTSPRFPENVLEAARRLQVRRSPVILRSIVRKSGQVDPDTIQLVEAAHPEMIANAFQEICTNWRFEAGRKNGEPVDVWATFEVTYRLR